MKNPEKVIDILTEKVVQLEAELWMARYDLAQLKKKEAEKETRPSAEKAEEMR